MTEYRKFPYRSEFPDSGEGARNHQTLEDALEWARWTIHSRWRETNEYGVEGGYVHDAETAVITNRNTRYRWILRRSNRHVEFQTPQMLEEAVAGQSIDIHLSIEEAEALARTAMSVDIKDKRTKALVGQALDQMAILCRQVRERIRAGDTIVDDWTRSIPRKTVPEAMADQIAPSEEIQKTTQFRYRPLGDPDNLSLKEAGEILGKARNTVYLWYRKGKFPPAIDVGPYIPYNNKPVIVVPRYRLEAWQAGERMPNVLAAVFETQGLHEAPWACFTARKGASRDDIDFWIKRRDLQKGLSKDGRRIYGEALEEKAYELKPIVDGHFVRRLSGL